MGKQGWADYRLFCETMMIPPSTVSTWAKRQGWQTVAMNGRVYYPRKPLMDMARKYEAARVRRQAA
jgi:hypothetical protein